MIQTAQALVPAAINTAQAGRSFPGPSLISGLSFAVNAVSGKSPFFTGSPPGASASVPIYKLTSAYLC
ncbi:MAG: hypothetical protein ACYDFU_06045 [Nitrospirota bacterium]